MENKREMETSVEKQKVNMPTHSKIYMLGFSIVCKKEGRHLGDGVSLMVAFQFKKFQFMIRRISCREGQWHG
jgi:hypothetical protein